MVWQSWMTIVVLGIIFLVIRLIVKAIYWFGKAGADFNSFANSIERRKKRK